MILGGATFGKTRVKIIDVVAAGGCAGAMQVSLRGRASSPESPAAVHGFVGGVVSTRYRKDDVSAVQLALTAAMANAIRHGCRGDITKRVQCSVSSFESDEVVIVVRD